MAIMIREFVENGKNFAKKVSDYHAPLSLTEGVNVKSNVDALDPNSLMVEIEGLHAVPFATRNFTRYTAKCLKDSIPSWTNPYRRPLLKHHNEENGEPIGRIVAAEYLSRNTRSGTPALKFTVNIPDEQAKEGVRNGLLSTTSVGIIAHDVRCSICGAPITDVEEGCPNGHERGNVCEMSDGTSETCYWDIHRMEAKELSYVDVPSDMYAKNIDYYPVRDKSSNQPQLKESLDKNLQNKGEQHMPEEMQAKLDEANAKVSELETKVTELTEANKASESKVTELTESIKSFEAQVAELTEKKTSLEAAAEEAAQLKESMEQEIAEAKAALKESMADTFVTLREAMGDKVEDVEAIKSRPVEALKYSILDMKESLAKKTVASKNEEDNDDKKVTPAAAGSVANPTIGAPELAESHKSKPVDLKAGLKSVFDAVLSARD